MKEKSDKLGAHIPIIYHFAMLQDEQRMLGFREAISRAVKPEFKVLELGGGSGVLSFFAAQHASKVYCIEQVPENAASARAILNSNPNGDRVEVICADAFEYLPPEPVDVVICEMLHVAMVREKQIEIIESFKKRYLEKYPGKLPVFIPEAFIQAIQPVNYNFDFFGYNAAVPLFQNPLTISQECKELADPTIYQISQYKDKLPLDISWSGTFSARENGKFNAVRFILKNILSILIEENRALHWHNQHLVLPIKNPIDVIAGDQISVSFSYTFGCEIQNLQNSLVASNNSNHVSMNSKIEVISESVIAENPTFKSHSSKLPTVSVSTIKH